MLFDKPGYCSLKLISLVLELRDPLCDVPVNTTYEGSVSVENAQGKAAFVSFDVSKAFQDCLFCLMHGF